MLECIKSFAAITDIEGCEVLVSEIVEEHTILTSLSLALQKGASNHQVNCLVCLNNIVCNSIEDAEAVSKNEGVIAQLEKCIQDTNKLVNDEAWYCIISLCHMKQLEASDVVVEQLLHQLS